MAINAGVELVALHLDLNLSDSNVLVTTGLQDAIAAMNQVWGGGFKTGFRPLLLLLLLLLIAFTKGLIHRFAGARPP